MHIIYLTPLEPQVYNDQESSSITEPPEGAAYIPDDFPLPSSFPRLSRLEAAELPHAYEAKVGEDEKMVTEQRTKMIMTVTVMEETTLPIPDPTPEPTPELTIWDELDAAYEEGVNSI